MPSIGDLYFAFRGDGARLPADAKAAGAKAGQSLGQSMIGSFKKSWSGGEVGKGLVQGLGMAGGLGAARLLAGAVHTVTDAFGDMVAGAEADQESISQLNASLKANIPAWNGDTTAIEKNILSKQRLGFSDEELRASLAGLVGATHDVAKAQEIQNAAMDLARFKRISLADASDALTKVEAGSYRILKGLGIVLKDGATQQDALNAVQKVASGQAEEYAGTLKGKLAAAQIRVNEVMEGFGYKILPLVTDALNAASDAADLLGGNLGQLGSIDKDVSTQLTEGTLAQLIQTRDALHQGLADLGALPGEGHPSNLLTFVSTDQIADLRKRLAEAQGAIDSFQARALSGADIVGSSWDHSASAVGVAAKKIGDDGKDMSHNIEMSSNDAKYWMGVFTDAVIADAGELVDQAFDPLIAADKLLADNAQIHAAKRILASKTATDAEKADAQATLDSVGKDQAQLLLTLTQAGATSSDAYKKGISDLKTEIKNASGPTKAALQGVLDKILAIKAAGRSVPINFLVSQPGLSGTHPGGGGPQQYASGGIRAAGVPSIVGEQGPELSIPLGRELIVPAPQTAALLAATRGIASAGAQAPVTNNNITAVLNGLPRATDPFEAANQLRRLAEFGMLTPRAPG